MSLVSVTEYSMMTGKDPGTIRKMLASGRLNGSKIGNQWVIEESEVFPDDKRVRSGDYKGWRNYSTFNSNRNLAKTIRSLVKEMRKIYGSHLESVILYGSYARGEQTYESDVDIALKLVPGYNRTQYNRMIDCVAEKELECGKVLSVIDIDSKKYNEWKDIVPFYKNISREGIVLWQA